MTHLCRPPWRALALVTLALACAACESTVPSAPDASAVDSSVTADAARPPCAPADNVLLCGEPLLIAHRGGADERPEESLLAFEHAAAVGADVLELDVHTTLDGEVVCLHDDTVDRTTDGVGRVHELTLAQVRALDAGYRFTTDGGATFPYRGMGVGIATLSEVLAAHPTAWFSIEVKQTVPDMVDEALAVVDASGAANRVVLVSFSDAVVAEIRARRPELVTGMGAAEMLAFLRLNSATEARYSPPTTVMQLPANRVDAAVVARANRLGIRVHAWTVDDRATMETLLELGVHGLMTDDPSLLADVLAAR